MKIITRIFTAILTITLLVGCASTPSAPEYVETEVDTVETILPYVKIAEEVETAATEPTISWLVLSLEAGGRYGAARTAVRKFYYDFFAIIDAAPHLNADDVPIAIAFYDLNRDGVEEIIAQISSAAFGGARSYGGLIALLFDGNKITNSIGLAQLPHSPERLSEEGAELLGIIHTEHEWPDIYIARQRIWSPARFSTGELPHYSPRDAGVAYEDESGSMSSWVGLYRFGEFAPGVVGSNQTWAYEIMIFHDRDNEYSAHIRVDGWMTLIRMRAHVVGNDDEIDLIFQGSLPPDTWEDRYGIGDVLLSFRREGEHILTEWGEFRPMLPESEISGEVHFELWR